MSSNANESHTNDDYKKINIFFNNFTEQCCKKYHEIYDYAIIGLKKWIGVKVAANHYLTDWDETGTHIHSSIFLS